MQMYDDYVVALFVLMFLVERLAGVGGAGSGWMVFILAGKG